MEDLISAPSPTHLVYIPAILLVGAVIGYIWGRKAGIKEGEAEAWGGDSNLEDDDLLL